MFALLDCNNFYVSCERAFQPQYLQKPVCVLSNNDGCVISRSNEAKALGIPMGAVAFEYDTMFKQNQVKLFSANFVLYGDLSRRVMNKVREYCSDVEVYSIDEAFMNFSSQEQYLSIREHCLKLRNIIYKGIGIPTSIGIAPTKTLAKVANRIAKKYPERTQDVYCIETRLQIEKALKWLPIEDVWGIGRRLAERFQKRGVRTAWDFTQLHEATVRKEMGVVGVRMFYELKGIPQLGLELPKTKQSIGVSRTFSQSITTLSMIEERIVTFAMVASEKLRAQKSCGNLITVFIRTNTKKTDEKQYVNHFTVSLALPSSSAIEIAKAAKYALSKIFIEGYSYKKAGIIVDGIVPETARQMNLFIEDQHIKHRPVMQVIDNLNKKYKCDKIKLASQDLETRWIMKRQYLSKEFTTNLKDLLVVKA